MTPILPRAMLRILLMTLLFAPARSNVRPVRVPELGERPETIAEFLKLGDRVAVASVVTP